MKYPGKLKVRSDDIGAAVANPGQYTMLGWLKSILNALASIGSDTTPVNVTANLKSGSYAYASLGSPSASASNTTVYSNAFAPTGEKVTAQFAEYLTGNRTMASDGYVYLECDLSGGTTYKPVHGSKILFSDIATWATTNGHSWIATWAVRGGNCRFAINFGTITGSTGLVGYNVHALN